MKKIFQLFILFIPGILLAQKAELVIPVLDATLSHVAWIEDQNLLLTGGSDKNVKIWQPSDGRLLVAVPLPGEYDQVSAIAVAAVTKNYAILTQNTLYWLDSKTFALQKAVDVPRSVAEQSGQLTTAVFSKDGQTLFVGAGGYDEITLFSIKKGEKALKKLGAALLDGQELDPINPDMAEPARRGVSFLSLSPDGKTLVASAGNKEVFTFAVTGGAGKKVPALVGQCAQYLPNGQVVVSDRSLQVGTKITTTISVFDPGFKPLWTKNLNFGIDKIEAFPLKNQCILSTTSQYVVLNADTKTIGAPVVWPSAGFTDAAISSDEKRLAYCGLSPSLSVYDLATNKDIAAVGTAIFSVGGVYSDPESNCFLLKGSDSPVSKFIRIQSGQLVVHTLPAVNSITCALSSNGHQGIWTGYEGKDYYFDTKDNPVVFEEIADNTGNHFGVSFSKDGSIFATSTESGLFVFDSKTKELLTTIEVPDYQILEGAFSDDNTRFVASKGASSAIFGSFCWEIPSGKILWELETSDYGQFRFIEKDTKIRAISKDIFCILDAATGKLLSEGKKMDAGPYKHSFSIAPDNDVAIDSYMKNLYNVKTGENIKLPGLTGDFAILKGSKITLANDFKETAINPNQLIVYDLIKQQEIAQIYLFNDSNDWIVLANDGRFDASKGAMNAMYWRKDKNLISLSALSEKFYTPKLLHQLIGKDSDVAPVDINTLKNPPTVKIKANEPGQRNLVVSDNVPSIEVSGDKIKLTIEAQSADDAVAEIRLFHNGKRSSGTTRNLIVEDEKTSATKTKIFEIQLVPGENIFKATAFNTQRTESSPDELRVVYKPNAGTVAVGNDIQLWLVVVGINEYKNKKYNLNYASADAKAFKNAIEKANSTVFSKVNATYIGDAQATKGGITAVLDGIKAAARPQDVLVFYYAGHGVVGDNKQFYLVPTDVTQLYGNDGGLESNGLSSKELRQYATDIAAQKQLFILDACQSAGALTDVLSRGAAEEKALDQLARSTGTYWLTASGSEQFASEFTQLGHGAFTYALLEALSGKADTGDGQISVQELDAYLQKVVPELTEKHKGTPQYPASYGLGNDFPIGVVKQ